jgi:hypothetical protein
MRLWSNILSLLGKEAGEMPFRKVLSHQLIERSQDELDSFDRWKTSTIKADALIWLRMSFEKFKNNRHDKTDGLDFLCCNTTNGFVIKYDATRWTKLDFQHLFDYLKQQVVELGYQKYVSEIKVVKECSKELTIERHYLKPPIAHQDGDTSIRQQLFGNILICMNSQGKQLENIKFSATIHHGRQYTTPLDFRELMDDVLR